MNRIIEIILSSLLLDRVILEEKLEKKLNTPNISVDSTISESKNLLRELVINEQMITKFQTLIKQPEQNDRINP